MLILHRLTGMQMYYNEIYDQEKVLVFPPVFFASENTAGMATFYIVINMKINIFL